jgi:hypothetical protein
MVKTIDLTNSLGTELTKYIDTTNKFNLFVKSVPYNQNGAYYPLYLGSISIDCCLYNHLNKNDLIKNLFVNYYNNDDNIKNSMPKISVIDIESIELYILPKNYTPYYT